MLAASLKRAKGVSLPQLDWLAVPKNCSRVTEAILHIVCVQLWDG